MNIQDYYRQHPEEILYRDKQVVITFSADHEKPCYQFRDPQTMKVVFTIPFDVIKQAERKAGLVPAFHDIEIMKKIKARKQGQI